MKKGGLLYNFPFICTQPSLAQIFKSGASFAANIEKLRNFIWIPFSSFLSPNLWRWLKLSTFSFSSLAGFLSCFLALYLYYCISYFHNICILIEIVFHILFTPCEKLQWPWTWKISFVCCRTNCFVLINNVFVLSHQWSTRFCWQSLITWSWQKPNPISNRHCEFHRIMIISFWPWTYMDRLDTVHRETNGFVCTPPRPHPDQLPHPHLAGKHASVF